MTNLQKQSRAALLALLIILCNSGSSLARVGGGGGHGSHGGGYSGGGGYGGGGFYVGGGSPGIFIVVFIIIIVLVVVRNASKKNGNTDLTHTLNTLLGEDDGEDTEISLAPAKPFPSGLDPQKVAYSFMAIQDAWQKKDLSNVRKWISDGMYQRLTTQFRMMKALDQSNHLSNIRISNITCAGTYTDGQYEVAEVAISFSMDDSFISNKYPEFNEEYDDDTDTEFWTFIRRSDSPAEKNLYDNNNCPNCGAPFEVKMGEISRCSNCNTLTNSAAYDWVLSEITQDEDYNGGAGLRDDANLKELMKTDPLFAVQRLEDVASNIFMQVMEVFAGDDAKRLTRFSDPQISEFLGAQKQKMGHFVFDRLYLNDVTLSGYQQDGALIKFSFDATATYRRVSTEGRIHMLDSDFVTQRFKLELSRNLTTSGKKDAAETVFSYECSSCGAPFTDTTQDHCTYCDAPVVDKSRNWVLTRFDW